MRKWQAAVIAAAVLGSTLGFAGSAQAGPTTALPETGVVVAQETAPSGESGEYGVLGADCWWPACGEAHNRTGKTLQIHRDSSSHWSCTPSGSKRKNLASGQGSTRYWPDTDCVRSTTCTIVFRGSVYKPGAWIRLYNPTWFYNVNC